MSIKKTNCPFKKEYRFVENRLRINLAQYVAKTRVIRFFLYNINSTNISRKSMSDFFEKRDSVLIRQKRLKCPTSLRVV